jgi:hypothetical protein
MNRNLDLHVTEEPTIIECEESVAMFVEEWRETFVLPSKFCAKTAVDGAKISDASIDKIVLNIWRVRLRFKLVKK